MNLNNITLTFFHIDLECMKENFLCAIGDEYSVCRINEYKNSISNYYVQQYQASQVKFLLFSPSDNPYTTVLFSNVIDGYFNLIKYVSKKCNLEYYHISISDEMSQFMKAYRFQYYSLSKKRNILCYQDPQWFFFEEGEALWFENTNLYKQRIKKNRLNKDIILEYLKSLGWELEKEDFWLPVNGFYEFSKKEAAICSDKRTC